MITERALGDSERFLRAVGFLGEVHQHDAVQGRLGEPTQESRSLCVGEVTVRAGDASTHEERVGRDREQLGIVVALQQERAAVPQVRTELARDVAEIGDQPDAVVSVAHDQGDLWRVVRDRQHGERERTDP